ncbi:hypothetical protein ACI3QN_12430, partial [Propionibacterium freudenreichii]|uniref:hypothetical protein n=1 Tax=Propionibacterium freudenreichii TaxID=1744 RepID=UPI003853B351
GNRSLKIWAVGPKRGGWCDYGGTGHGQRQSGDLLHLVAETRFAGDLGKAVKWARAHLGIDDADPAAIAIAQREARTLSAQYEARARQDAEAK